MRTVWQRLGDFLRVWFLTGFPCLIKYRVKPESGDLDGRYIKRGVIDEIEILFPLVTGTCSEIINHEAYHAKAYTVPAWIKAEAAEVYGRTLAGPKVKTRYVNLLEEDWREEALVRLADMRAAGSPLPYHSRDLACALTRITRPRPVAMIWRAAVTMTAAWTIVSIAIHFLLQNGDRVFPG